MPIIKIWIEIILVTMIMGIQFVMTTSTFQIHTQDKVLTKIDHVSVTVITHW
jgi:hypothetical protein